MAHGLIILTIGGVRVNDSFKGQVRRTSKKCGGGDETKPVVPKIKKSL
jgi:hypothetical protein